MIDEHTAPRRLGAVAEPVVRAASWADQTLLGDFLARLSPASMYSRFLTGMSGAPSTKLLAALLPEPPRGAAVLGFLGGELVGHALWVRLADPAWAEIAIVVGDRHQRRGIGTTLAAAVTEDLVTHGVSHIEAFSISTNRAVAQMVARAAPDARRELDGPTATYSFPARGRRGVLLRSA